MFKLDLSAAEPRYTFRCSYLGKTIHEEPGADMRRVASYLSDLSALLHPGDEFRILITAEDPPVVDGFIIGG